MSTTDKTGAILCELSGVTHEFTKPEGATLRVLEDINLQVRAGEIVALLGPSGCGKSTILRILAGLIRPTTGTVSYRGQELAGVNPGVAIVFQTFALYPWMTVDENIQVVLEAAGLDVPEQERRTLRAIRMVGLEGFEHAYPRELSGGMKQRVGMARAIAVQPEVIFLDEPFSHVDALTAEALRAEVVDIWARAAGHPAALLLVSHDIAEVIFMADRIVVLGARPGRVRTVIENPLPRPRDTRSPEFQRLVERLHEVIVGHEMPDPTLAGIAEPEHVPEALPGATTNDVVGLLEYLDARHGREDVFRIASDLRTPFGQMITVVKAAEMLDLVDTPRRTVVLTPDGRRFLDAAPDERHVIWGQKLGALVLFQQLRQRLLATEDQTIDADSIKHAIQELLPGEDIEQLFDTLVQWGRYGHLVTYEEDSGLVRMEREKPEREKPAS